MIKAREALRRRGGAKRPLSARRTSMNKETLQAFRAVRSYTYNWALKPEVEARLEKACSRLKSYLLLNGVNALRLGNYRVELVEGELQITALPPQGWEQPALRGLKVGQGVPQQPSALPVPPPEDSAPDG